MANAAAPAIAQVPAITGESPNDLSESDTVVQCRPPRVLDDPSSANSSVPSAPEVKPVDVDRLSLQSAERPLVGIIFSVKVIQLACRT